MKKLIFLITTFIAFSSQAVELKQVEPKAEVLAAVSTIYDMGRDQADSGGINAIYHFTTDETSNTFEVTLAALQEMKKFAEFEIVRTACHGKDLEKDNEMVSCLRLVLNRDSSVQANFQPNSIVGFIDEITEWFIGDELEGEWVSSLETARSYVLSHMPKGSKEFVLGYDYVADVFMSIMISPDKKQILVITGDYGA